MWCLERKLRPTVFVGRAGVLVAEIRYSWVLHSAMTIIERCMIRNHAASLSTLLLQTVASVVPEVGVGSVIPLSSRD
jgi:hypothetical protein